MEYIVEITLIIYVVVAFYLMAFFVFTVSKEKQENGIFPLMMITSVLWPIIIMFLIIDEKDKETYDNSESNKEKHK